MKNGKKNTVNFTPREKEYMKSDIYKVVEEDYRKIMNDPDHEFPEIISKLLFGKEHVKYSEISAEIKKYISGKKYMVFCGRTEYEKELFGCSSVPYVSSTRRYPYEYVLTDFDQNILDETVGPMNWERKHSRENANCTVSIWCKERGCWVSKEDTGTESNTEREKGLASDSFKDPETGYRKYIDVTSFIDYQLATEISGNIDGYRLSTYLYKYRDSVDPRFKMTLWDFDFAWGMNTANSIVSGNRVVNWAYMNNAIVGVSARMPFWFGRLMSDPAYVAQLKARYAEYRRGRYADVPAVIDSLSTLLTAGGAAERDRRAWPRQGELFLGASTYAKEVATVRSFALARIAWLDRQLGR